MNEMHRVLYYKAWLETRSRFYTALVVTISVCGFWTLGHTWVQKQWHNDLIQHPDWNYSAWFMRALGDYPFFLYHFIYADMFQKVWVIFAVLLGIGGLTREAAHGTAGYTLSLPVSRRTLFQVRSTLALAELFALSVIALVLIVVLSKARGLEYPISHGLSHGALLFFGGVVFLAASLCISQFAEGEHTPALIGLGGVGLLYFVMQPFVDGLPVSGLAIPFSIPKLMAGPPDLPSFQSVDWSGLTASIAAAASLVAIAVHRTRRRDY